MRPEEKIVKNLSHWHNSDLESLFDAILTIDSYPDNMNLGGRRNIEDLKQIIKQKRQ